MDDQILPRCISTGMSGRSRKRIKNTGNSVPPQRPQKLSAYLAKIVRNLSLNRLRSNDAQKRGAGAYLESYDELSNRVCTASAETDVFDELHLRECIVRWLQSLPKEQQVVFFGRYWYFDSVAAIAGKMQYSVGKTKMMLMRLRNDLKQYLEEGILV